MNAYSSILKTLIKSSLFFIEYQYQIQDHRETGVVIIFSTSFSAREKFWRDAEKSGKVIDRLTR